MGLVRRKEERSEPISVRVPASVKAELEELRRRADAEGFDLTATITETLIRLAKQVRGELDRRADRTSGTNRVGKTNGSAPSGMVDGRAA